MSSLLTKVEFTEATWDEVQGFDCGDKPYQLEVSNWLKGELGKDSALSAIKNTERPATIWLYQLEDRRLVGFGALGKSEWRWKGKKDPKIPVTLIIWYAVQKEFQKQPPGPPEGHYSAQILDDLMAVALDDQLTHPVLGLCVQAENQRAIDLYKRVGFTESLDPFIDKETGGKYQRMAMVLNAAALLQIRDAALKGKK